MFNKNATLSHFSHLEHGQHGFLGVAAPVSYEKGRVPPPKCRWFFGGPELALILLNHWFFVGRKDSEDVKITQDFFFLGRGNPRWKIATYIVICGAKMFFL